MPNFNIVGAYLLPVVLFFTRLLTILGNFLLFPFACIFKGLKAIFYIRMLPTTLVKQVTSKRGRIFIFFAGIGFSVIFIFVPYQLYTWFRKLPKPDRLITYGTNRSTKILDRNGRLLYEIYQDRQYTPVTLEQIPPYLIQATLAVEDASFYSHKGFHLASIMRAARANVLHSELQGASTITQQLVKNVLLTSERTLSRKVKELILAVLVESEYTKDTILELYLNNIPYGGTAWGVEAASQKFFGKSVSDLSLAEASMLAGLPSAPSIYSPLSNDFTVAKARQKYVLDRMVLLGYIDNVQAKDAYDATLEFIPQVDFIKAPHFVAYVRDYLDQTYGAHYIAFGGLTIRTTLDLDLQERVQELVRSEVEKSAYLNISNGAAVVLDPQTREILAYVGSIDYFKDDWGAFDVITAFRQPGSSIKPITYALAFQEGYTPAFILDDAPVRYFSYGGPYVPVNYDSSFHGKVTLRQALANSYNIPAVKLVNLVGVDNMVALGRDLGLQGWQVDNSYGLSVTLGGKEVRLLDLANVYATFAAEGVYSEVIPIISVIDSNGYELLHNATSTKKRVLSREVSYLISHILSDNTARAPAFGTTSALVVPGQVVAVKTGTTDNKRDNWTFGYTPSVVVGVWVGNNNNTPMNPYLASGLSGAAPIWNKIMQVLLHDQPREPFVRPENVFVKSDPDCAGLSEVFIKGTTVPKNLCVLEKDKKIDTEKD